MSEQTSAKIFLLPTVYDVFTFVNHNVLVFEQHLAFASNVLQPVMAHLVQAVVYQHIDLKHITGDIDFRVLYSRSLIPIWQA